MLERSVNKGEDEREVDGRAEKSCEADKETRGSDDGLMNDEATKPESNAELLHSERTALVFLQGVLSHGNI